VVEVVGVEVGVIGVEVGVVGVVISGWVAPAKRGGGGRQARGGDGLPRGRPYHRRSSSLTSHR
jgi:hypothetical protein